jgi:FeS assembly SUF system protein
METTNAATKLLDEALQAEEPQADDAQPAGVKARIIEQQAIEVLCSIYDPEIPVNIYELGLIYDLQVKPAGEIDIKMTLTSPACPVAGTLPVEVENKLAAIPGVTNVNLELVWDPPYGMEMMSEAARLQLGLL